MKTRVKKPKRPDCNSCYHFSKSDFNETEGYCRICKKHLNSKEGEECEQFEPYSLYCDTDSMKENEFNLNSATKYKDGEPMMTDLPVQLVRLLKRIEFLEKKIRKDEIGMYSAHSLKEYFDDEMSEEMKAVADEYIKHEERILKLERLCNQLNEFMKNVDITVNSLDERLSIIEEQVERIMKYIEKKELEHTCSNFCGNCTHCSHVAPDVTYRCELSGEIVDPDDSSCAMFEPPF